MMIQCNNLLFVRLFDKDYLQLSRKDGLEFHDNETIKRYIEILNQYFPNFKFRAVRRGAEIVEVNLGTNMETTK